MNQFLLKNYFFITHGVEILAAVTGIIFYKKYKFTAAKYFVRFLIFIALADFIGDYANYVNNNGIFKFLKGTILEGNWWWNTLSWKIASSLFFSFYFMKNIKNIHYKQVLKYSTSAFFVFSMGYIVINLEAFFKQSFPIIDLFGAIIIFMCAIFYFIEILQSDHVLSFYKSLNFYIAAVIFIWWLIVTPLVFYDIYFKHQDWNFVFLKGQIYLLANLFMYLTFTFAFIWCKPQND